MSLVKSPCLAVFPSWVVGLVMDVIGMPLRDYNVDGLQRITGTGSDRVLVPRVPLELYHRHPGSHPVLVPGFLSRSRLSF